MERESEPWPTFEGRLLPRPEGLRALLDGAPADRAWLVRAAVVHRDLADSLGRTLAADLDDPTVEVRAVALQLARALSLRILVPLTIDAWEMHPERFIGVPDPLRPGETLARTALAFIVDARLRGEPRVEGFLRAALGVAELRVEVAYAIGPEDCGALLPHLETLLSDKPALAGPLGTWFALRRPDLCEAACGAASALPLSTRRVFGEALLRQLARVHAVGRGVACRRLLALD